MLSYLLLGLELFPLPCDAPAEFSWFIHNGQFMYG